MSEYLFAYGTLITGGLEPRIDALVQQGCRRCGRGQVAGRLYDLGSYPGALPATGLGQRIRGYVLELPAPQRCLPFFDSYEGYDPADPRGSLYRREPVNVDLEGRQQVCWIYWLNQLPPGARRIAGGDWFAGRQV